MTQLEDVVYKVVRAQLARELPHTCFTCKFFTFKNEEGKGNRGCRYPKKLTLKGGVCQMWKFQTDARKRKPCFISYYPETK